VVVSEDWAFFEHDGVDYRQLWSALRDRLFRGARLRGASTITQQLAKNMFLSHDRSFFRKLLEVVLARALEAELSKEEILERYLNIVEWGPDVVGLSEATVYYFQKTPRSLTVREAALLAQLLPSPVRYGKSLKAGDVTEYAEGRVTWIRSAMIQAGFLPRPTEEPELDPLTVPVVEEEYLFEENAE
jgi:monofunctional biosynthetic peptidoglycan transglycosylase